MKKHLTDSEDIRIPFALSKLISMVFLLIPFITCWYLYYEPRTLTVHSKQVSVLLFIVFIFTCYYFSYHLDCFRVAISQIRDVVFSQVVALGVTDALMYIIIWMLSIHMPNIIPGFCCFLVQILVSILCAILMNWIYFATHRPLETIVIYDVRQGMEDLVEEYGLQKRFHVEKIYAIEEILENLDLLNDVKAVFLCGIHSHDRNIVLKKCIYEKIKVFVIPRVGDVMMSGAESIHMFHLPILRCQYYTPSLETRFIKRVIDITLSLIAFIVCSPLFIITAIAVKSDGGPAFYKQKRLTQNGKVFEIIKFRSMRVDAEKYSGAVLSAGENDPRITKVGRFIRACRLDEIPQLINILRGDMSIVGPRPERPEIAEKIQEDMPEFQLRTQVKAGLTGYAQVYGKYNTTFYDKLLMDLMYIANFSILQDLCIMMATVKILFSKESTEGVGEESPMMMYEERLKEKYDIDKE